MSDAIAVTEESDGTTGFVPPSRRDLLLGGMLAAAAGIAYVRQPRKRLASIARGELEKLLPLTIGPWRYENASGIVLPPPDALAALLYDQQLARSYMADLEPQVMLVAAYGAGQSGAIQVHRPEICYPASGFRLTHAVEELLPIGDGRSIPVRAFTAESDTRVEQVLYWSRIADELPTGWTSQRLAIMRENIRGYVPDGLLVRMSLISPDRLLAMKVLHRFARDLLSAAGSDGRRKLLGDAYA